MGFTATCLVNDKFDQSGFESRHEAIKYIEALICDMCLAELKKGFVAMVDDGVAKEEKIHDVLDTSCGQNFLIVTDEEFESAESLEDLFIAAGLKPKKKRDDGQLPH